MAVITLAFDNFIVYIGFGWLTDSHAGSALMHGTKENQTTPPR